MINVYFLDKNKSKIEFLNIFKKVYKHKYEIPEIIARCKYSRIKFKGSNNLQSYRNYMENVYSKKIKEFTLNEKKKIYKTVLRLYKIVKSYNYNRKIKIPFLKNWFFFKLDSNIDWGYPYTVKKFIVLNENVLKYNFDKTLLHEMFHIIQRYNQKLFNKFYKKEWNFIELKKK